MYGTPLSKQIFSMKLTFFVSLTAIVVRLSYKLHLFMQKKNIE
jgi:hypothetical protein